MKKGLKIALMLLCCSVILSALLVACKPAQISVIFDPYYAGANAIPRKVNKGSSVDAPTVQRPDYEFAGWYTSSDFSGSPQSFPVTLNENTTFYAKWNPIVNETVEFTGITAQYTGPSLAIGEQPDKSLLTVTAHYSDGTSKRITNFSVGIFDSSTAGEREWEISYTDNGVTHSTTVKINVSSGEVADMSIHFMELGNNSNGDSIYIKAGDTDILIDAGSTAGSATTIQNYINKYCTDGILEYVIVTHADEDHIAAFTRSLNSGGGIFEMYECKTIIDFARTSKNTSVLTTYYERRDAEVAAGANHYTA